VPTYATRSALGPYHLVEGRGGLTLCGLKVSKIHQTGSRVTLNLVKEKPEVGRLCRHCVRLANQGGRKEKINSTETIADFAEFRLTS
jgi:hypothetical protein